MFDSVFGASCVNASVLVARAASIAQVPTPCFALAASTFRYVETSLSSIIGALLKRKSERERSYCEYGKSQACERTLIQRRLGHTVERKAMDAKYAQSEPSRLSSGVVKNGRRLIGEADNGLVHRWLAEYTLRELGRQIRVDREGAFGCTVALEFDLVRTPSEREWGVPTACVF